MTMNYYLAWLHFDSHGRMSTRLPDGHRVLEVLHNSGSNRHPPALWVLVEAVVATPSYTPATGFPATGEMPVDYNQQPQQPQQPPVYQQTAASHPSMPIPVPTPVPSRAEQYDYRESTDAGQNGRTEYPDLYPENLSDPGRRDTNGYRNSGDYVPGVPMAPATKRM